MKDLQKTVYRPSDKALRRSDLAADDRFVFVERNYVLWYKAGTTVLIMMDLLKSRDSHMAVTNEPVPDSFTIARANLPCNGEYTKRVQKLFNVTIV